MKDGEGKLCKSSPPGCSSSASSFLWGEGQSFWQASVNPSKIFQAKFNTLNSVQTVKQATREEYGMQVCEEREFVHDVV